MIDNTQKLYEIAGVGSVGFNTYTLEDVYPPFTAEKQLGLIKWLGSTFLGHFYSYVSLNRFSNNFGHYCVGIGNCKSYHEQFEQALANLVIELYNDLTDKQKE